MRFATLFIWLVFLTTMAPAQPYMDAQTRHRFAQLNFGADIRTFASGDRSYRATASGAILPFTTSPFTEARLAIGGTHFWGHTDFYVAFPVAYTHTAGFATGIETAAKVYPWRIGQHKLRPYAGLSYLSTSYRQDQGTTLVRNKLPLLTGVTLYHRQQLFDAGITWNYANQYRYYITPGTQVPVYGPPLAFSMGYKWMLETTLSAEKNWKNGNTQRLTDTLARLHRLNGFTITVAPSVAFFTRKSSRNIPLPFIDNHKISNIFCDMGIGYYLHRPDIQTGMVYRSYNSTLAAYGYTQYVRRRSVVAEGYRFFGDYHGFAPFIGPAVSYENLSVHESTPTTPRTSTRKTGIYPGIAFGWDIRPTRLQSFYLRGNFRYTPGLRVSMPMGGSILFDALEVNFIQLVIFPGRMF